MVVTSWQARPSKTHLTMLIGRTELAWPSLWSNSVTDALLHEETDVSRGLQFVNDTQLVA